MKIIEVTRHDDHLAIDISGTRRRYHYLWLRDNSPDTRSANGQRLHESNSIDRAVKPISISHSDRELTISWNDDAELTYPVEFLDAWVYDTDSKPAASTVLWDTRISEDIGSHDYNRVCVDDSARAAWLGDVERYGFALLCNVPAAEEKVFDVVKLFGFVRETNYGRLFNVRAEEMPSNLAYTPVPLSVHTDNPYRDPCPTLQLLHCLIQADEGGETALVDGFHAALRLREVNPAAFELLTGNEILFSYQGEGAIVETRCPIITLDTKGAPKRIRINNRSLTPLILPYDRVMPFYEALFLFRSILEDETLHFRYHLEAGDLVLFDNERVLHGRVGHSIGERHLQGCYADRDGLLSTLRVLERDNA
jgi:gamma-butyrobetaine dioxygenase